MNKESPIEKGLNVDVLLRDHQISEFRRKKVIFYNFALQGDTGISRYSEGIDRINAAEQTFRDRGIILRNYPFFRILAGDNLKDEQIPPEQELDTPEGDIQKLLDELIDESVQE